MDKRRSRRHLKPVGENTATRSYSKRVLFILCLLAVVVPGTVIFIRGCDSYGIPGLYDPYSPDRNLRGRSGLEGTVTAAQVQEANQLAKAWLFNNIRENGLFIYQVAPSSSARSRNQNNELRQLMASRVLAVESVTNELWRPAHRKNLDFIFLHWYKQLSVTRDPAGAAGRECGIIVYENKSKLGANAMFLRTLVASPYFNEYRSQAQTVAEGIVALQNADGSFNPWYIEPSYDYDTERLLTFYSGEAILALIEYVQLLRSTTGDAISTRYYTAATRAADYYLNRYVDKLDENYYPAYVPWHTMAYAHLFDLTKDPRYVEAVFVMNDKLLEMQDTTTFVGRFYNPATPQYGTPHAASDAIYLEGLGYAYDLARRNNDQFHSDRYQQALSLGMGYLLSLQCQRTDRQWYGAICIRNDEPRVRTRVDATQHAIDAFTFCTNACSAR